MEKIPIIILNWNGIEDTINCIDSLKDQTYKNFQIYLVDNGSSGNDQDILTEKFSDDSMITLIFNDENLGFAKGNNKILKTLLKENQSEYVILLNNDTLLDKKWLESLITSAKGTNADMVSSKLINFRNRNLMDNAGHLMLNTGEILPIGHGEDINKFNSVFENFGVCAGACLYSTQMLKDIGLFDEYFHTVYEDVELGVRAVVSGYMSIFEPSAIVYHKGAVSVDKIRSEDYSLKIQNNISYTFLKTMPWTIILMSIPFLIIKYLGITIFGIIFWRPKLIKIHFVSLLNTFTSERKLIMKARKSKMPKRKLSSFQILKKQTFFLNYYIKYFKKFILGRKATVIEQY